MPENAAFRTASYSWNWLAVWLGRIDVKTQREITKQIRIKNCGHRPLAHAGLGPRGRGVP